MMVYDQYPSISIEIPIFGTRTHTEPIQRYPQLLDSVPFHHIFHGRSPGSKNGGTVAYKAIFWGDTPLHSPYIGLIYGRYLQSRIPEMTIDICIGETGSFRIHSDLGWGWVMLGHL